MDSHQEDYFAPLGMSQPDFNSMLRRRNLAHLNEHLIEQSRVTMPGTGTSSAPRDTAQLVKVEAGGADFPEPLVADFVDEDVTRKSSSFYCRGIDEDSPRFAAFFDRPSSKGRASASESQSLAQMPLESRKGSKRAFLFSFFPGFSRVTNVSSYNSGTAALKAKSCPLPLDFSIDKTPRLSATELQTLSSSSPASTTSRATSASSYNSGTAAPRAGHYPSLPPQSPVKEARRISASKLQALHGSFPAASWSTASVDTHCSGTAAPKAEYCLDKIDPWFHQNSRMSNNKPRPSPAALGAIDKAHASHRAQQQQHSHENTRGSASQASSEPELDLPKAIAALLRKNVRLKELLEEQPPVERIVELGRLRRVIRTLDFNFDDAILLASDLTTLVPVQRDGSDVIEKCTFFRRRLARTVWCRVESLRRELRVGDALKIEHWYKDVVNLVGWLDEHEARMSWSWLENGGLF